MSFSEIYKRIKSQKSRYENLRSEYELVSIKSDFKLSTLIDILCCLEYSVPLAIFPSGLTPQEALIRRQQLPAHFDTDEKKLIPGDSKLKLHQDCQLVLFTSGSEGTPKAVQLSSKNIIANRKSVIQTLEFREQEQHLFLKMHYSFGLLGQLLPALKVGMTTYLHNSILDLKPLLEDSSILGMLSGIPSQLSLLLAFSQSQKNSKISSIVSAGGFLNPTLRKSLRSAFPNACISSNYGQTECSPRILSYNSNDPNFESANTGYLLPDYEAKIEENTLWVKGPQVMLGYTRPEITEQKIENGWLNTFDRVNVDNNGLYKIIGRSDGLVKIQGELVSLREVELIINEALGKECIVFYKDNTLCIVLEEGSEWSKISQLHKSLKGQLSPHKTPRKLHIVKSFIYNQNHKLDRKRSLQTLEESL